MRFYHIILIFLSIFIVSVGNAQLKIQVGEHFMNGVSFKKLHVCVEDHSVWAITTTGAVYFKRTAETDFQPFLPTQGLNITAITGFNEEEMYFVTGDKFLQVIRGVATQMTVPFPSVTRINDISVVYGKYTENYYNPAIHLKEYVSIATNKNLYFLVRNSGVISDQYNYDNQPSVSEPDWKINYSGFKSVGYWYGSSADRCGVEADHITLNNTTGAVFISVLPDKGIYPSQINAAVFTSHYYSAYNDLSYAYRYNIWGTNNGLYVRDWNRCNFPNVKQRLVGEQVNDLEEIYALTPLIKQDYIMAATSTGVYYTAKSIFPDGMDSPDFMKFTKLNGFPLGNATALSTETTSLSVYAGTNQFKYYSVCEKIVWVTTASGIYKLYLTLDQDYFNDFKFGDIWFSKTMSNTDYGHPKFDICGTQTVDATVRIPSEFSSQIQIKWYKDGVEIPSLIGKLVVPLSESGEYEARIVSLCENISVKSVPITINNSSIPEITFAYPNEVDLCSNQTYTMQTKNVAGYTYRWFKDNIQLSGANQNSYTASASGIYRVEVSNCSNIFSPSASVKVNIITIAPPVITANKASYCFGETATLLVNNPNGYSVKWYMNGTELTNFADQDEIAATQSGSYKAVFLNENNCSGSALVPFQLTILSKPNVTVNRSSDRTLCNGEAVELSAVHLAGATYVWSNGATTEKITVRQSGNYSVTVTSAEGCTDTSIPVNVLVNPKIELDQPDPLTICSVMGEEKELKAPDGYAYYIWNGIRGQNSSLTVKQPGSYRLTVEDNLGCTATVSYIVNPYCKEIIIPNTFSPNGDAINDLWTVVGLENDPTARIKIFNRYGTLIFETTSRVPYWDGKIKNQAAPVGTYFYIITTKNSVKAISGSLTLIR